MLMRQTKGRQENLRHRAERQHVFMSRHMRSGGGSCCSFKLAHPGDPVVF